MANDPPPNPRKNDTWLDDDGELRYFDGDEWVLYENLPNAASSDPPSLFR